MPTEEPSEEPRVELFRPAAVAAHRAGSSSGGSIASSHRFTSSAYWTLLAVIVTVVVAAFSIHVEETSAGVWATGSRPGYAVVALPIGAITRLQPGLRVGLRTADGKSTRDTTISNVLSPQRIELAPATLGPLPRALRAGSAIALVEVLLPVGANGRGTATAHLSRHTLASELIPALRREPRARNG